jgi:hypothetical protein
MNGMLYLLLMLSLVLCCVAATHAQQTNPPVPITAPAPPTLPPSPVDTFRKIMAMSPQEREKFLSPLSSEKREIVMLKLHEYQGLPAEQREQRLRALQARVWVRQLIKLPGSNRVERLAAVPPADRQLIEGRLAQWDSLRPELQKEVLTNEIAIRYIARLQVFDPGLPPFPIDSRVEHQLKHWGELSKADRTDILNNFQYFVEDLSEKERRQVLVARPDAKKALDPIVGVANLPKEQRDRYIAGMKRFAALSSADRKKFLFNAARWEKMSPEQRESWRVLAKKLSNTFPSSPPPAPPVGRPNASIVPSADHVALDLPSR